MGVAVLSRAIAQRLKRPDAEEVFVCGLLHNLGQILLATASPKQYEQVLEEIEVSESEYTAAEEKIFQVAHPILGALLLRRWNFAPHFARVVIACMDPLDETESAEAAPREEIHAHIVRLADLLCHAAQIGSPAGYPLDPIAIDRRIVRLGLNGDLDAAVAAEELLGEAKLLFEQNFALYH